MLRITYANAQANTNAHLKLTASLSQRRCHHQRVSALCSAALAVTLAWKRPICLSTMAVSHSAGELLYWLKPKGTCAGMRAVSTRRMAVRLACLRKHNTQPQQQFTQDVAAHREANVFPLPEIASTQREGDTDGYGAYLQLPN